MDEADGQRAYSGAVDDDDSPHGHGTIRYFGGARAGNTYTGWWQHGAKHGPGTYTWSNGDVYCGDFAEDDACGLGTLTHHDGHRLVGCFEAGVMHGRGLAQLPNGTCYEGEFVDGFAHGRGREWRLDRDGGFWGVFVLGRRHGWGLHTDADGAVEARRYEEDELVAADLGARMCRVAGCDRRSGADHCARAPQPRA